jgi:hypothetical protein
MVHLRSWLAAGRAVGGPTESVLDVVECDPFDVFVSAFDGPDVGAGRLVVAVGGTIALAMPRAALAVEVHGVAGRVVAVEERDLEPVGAVPPDDGSGSFGAVVAGGVAFEVAELEDAAHGKQTPPVASSRKATIPPTVRPPAVNDKRIQNPASST